MYIVTTGNYVMEKINNLKPFSFHNSLFFFFFFLNENNKIDYVDIVF